MTAEERLRELGIELPEPPPRHEFVPATLAGETAFVSGHAPYRDGKFLFVGKVGAELDLATGQQAAQLALLGCLRALQDSLGTLDAVRQVLKLTGYVNCATEFVALPKVTDSASTILVALFGDRGRHARTTVGVSSLPNGVAVEVELIIQIALARESGGRL